MTHTPAPTRLVLVRHGEPCESVRGKCYGRLDPPLSSAGREQMSLLARHLATWGAAQVYSSPLRRAMESAALLTGMGTAPIVDERLRERDFGALEGMAYDDIARTYPDVFRAWMERPTAAVVPGGEAVAVMAARVRQALDDLRRDRSHQTTVVVAHGGVNRIALADALGLPLESMFRLGQDFGCFNVVEYWRGYAVVRAMNVPAGSAC